MRTKNAKPITAAESRHMAWVKEQPCCVCGAPPPSDCHHIEQGLHFATLALCKSCHVDNFNGVHGQARMWRVKKLTEFSALNSMIERLAEHG